MSIEGRKARFNQCRIREKRESSSSFTFSIPAMNMATLSEFSKHRLLYFVGKPQLTPDEVREQSVLKSLLGQLPVTNAALLEDDFRFREFPINLTVKDYGVLSRFLRNSYKDLVELSHQVSPDSYEGSLYQAYVGTVKSTVDVVHESFENASGIKSASYQEFKEKYGEGMKQRRWHKV